MQSTRIVCVAVEKYLVVAMYLWILSPNARLSDELQNDFFQRIVDKNNR